MVRTFNGYRGRLAAISLILIGLGSLARAQGVPEQRARLKAALDLYQQNNYERAADGLDLLVEQFGPPPYPADMPAEKRALMIETLELRALVRMSLRPKRTEQAKADLQQILIYLDPAYELSKVASFNSDLRTEYALVRRGAVGRIVISVKPEDASVLVWERTVKNGAMLDLPGGNHKVVAMRQGYKPQEKPIYVVPGGDILSVELELDRLASSVFVVTEPAGVEVVFDKVSRGTTAPDPNAPPGSGLSKAFEVGELANGDHDVLLKLECYEDLTVRLPINKADDYRPQPFRLTPAFASIEVSGGAAGAQVFYDGQSRGAIEKPDVPVVIPKVCRGSHVVEVKTPHARDLARYAGLPAGRVERFQARLRPGIAIVSDSGASSNVVGGTNYYSSAEEDLRDSTAIKLYSEERAAKEFVTANNLVPDWLHFDLQGQMVGKAATIGPDGRRALVEKLAAQLGAQGVAAIAPVAGSADNSQALLLLFASGSAVPDVIEWRIKDRAANAAAVSRLDSRLRHLRSSIGLTPIDVAEVGVVVGAVESGGSAAVAKILPGAIITRAGNTQITSAAQLVGIVDAHAAGTLSLELQPPNEAVKRVDVAVVQTPSIVSLDDRSLLTNKLTIDYRYLAATNLEPLEQVAVRLNLAALLMRLQNYSEAEEVLRFVSGRLKEATGRAIDASTAELISGTVQYLLGVCFEERRNYPEARRVWQALASANGNLLTENGEPLKELATQKLKAADSIAR